MRTHKRKPREDAPEETPPKRVPSALTVAFAAAAASANAHDTGVLVAARPLARQALDLLPAVASFLRIKAPLLFHPRSEACARLHTLGDLRYVDAVNEFARFVCLKVAAQDADGTVLAPTPLAEVAWRACVLETQLLVDLHATCGMTMHYSARDFCDDPFHAEQRARRVRTMGVLYAALFNGARPLLSASASASSAPQQHRRLEAPSRACSVREGDLVELTPPLCQAP
jgi:hypothetical protein